MLRIHALLGLVAGLVLCATSLQAADPGYKPGEIIEYRDGTAVPEKWERGVIVMALEGGKQYIIRRKPTQFDPVGAERAYSPADLRRPVLAGPMVTPPVPPALPAPPALPDVGPRRPSAPIRVAPGGRGPLTEEEVLAYMRLVFGGADRLVNEGNLNRDVLTEQIRDYIKKHGVAFKAPLLGQFHKKVYSQGTGSATITQAIDGNYGPHPKLTDYVGTFYLRKLTRVGKISVGADGLVRTTADDPENEEGRLTINGDGTYEWEVRHGDPPAKWLRGKWHEAQPDEMISTEGGPAVVLEKAKGNVDYQARLVRDPEFAGWLDVGEGPTRNAVVFGRRAESK